MPPAIDGQRSTLDYNTMVISILQPVLSDAYANVAVTDFVTGSLLL